MDSLNRAFKKAFSHTASRETLQDLLECIGEELNCDRISIFEVNMDMTCDNTYEWCRPGKAHMSELMQSLPLSTFDDWMDEMTEHEFVCIRDVEAIRVNEPDVYRLFRSQEVNTAIAASLAFHGKDIGFFILENPDEEVLREPDEVIPGMRYILSSLVYSDYLLKKLERIGYLDHLTNTGNMMGLQEKLEELNPDRPVGLVYCEVLGWDHDDHRLTEIQEEQALIRTGEILQGVFSNENVFRVAQDEFLALLPEMEARLLDIEAQNLRHLFEDQDLLVAVGVFHVEKAGKNHDRFVRQAHLLAHNEIRALTRVHDTRKQTAQRERNDDNTTAHISLYSMNEFFKQAPRHFGDFYDESLLTVVVDINYFRLYNDIFGHRAGSVLLEQVAERVQQFAEANNGLAGYLGGDNFIAVFPTREKVEGNLNEFIRRFIETLDCPEGFSPAIGAYLSHDKQETLVAMYDHAITALQMIKGSYVEHFRFYDVEHSRRDRETKMLMLDAKRGIMNGEFLFYMQPQVNERDGKIVGAEALSRWINRGQFVSPAQFIPALEKSGYIYLMDTYIWEEVCRWLRSLIDRGIRPVPISINVSRIDFYFDDIAEHIINLTAKYGIEPRYLGVEITESAFTDNMDTICDAVRKLHDAGFRVLMDDFGSGSSSLSMLHTIHLDVLKTDVRFMSSDAANSRAYSIVGSVVSMAHMIGMIVVTEGVETEEQRQNLVAMGGNFAQGFYFYRPMPVEEFEALLCDPEKIGDAFAMGMHVGENHLKFRDLIGQGMLSDTLLDNIIGAAAVYRLEGEVLSLTQTNEQYRQLAKLGQTGLETPDQDALFSENREAIQTLFLRADQHPFDGAVGTVRISRNMEIVWVEIRVFLLYSCDHYRLYFLAVQDDSKR